MTMHYIVKAPKVIKSIIYPQALKFALLSLKRVAIALPVDYAYPILKCSYIQRCFFDSVYMEDFL